MFIQKVANKVTKQSRKIMWLIGSLLALGVALGVYLDLHLYLRPVPPNFEDAVKLQMRAAKLPSLTVLVFEKENVVYSKSFGLADVENGRPATPDSLYQIASISKLVVAASIMRLYEKGKLQLDDDVNNYLPFKVRNPKHPETPITVRMLLAHVSSIDDGPAYSEGYTIGKSEDPMEPLEDFLASYFTEGKPHYNARGNFYSHKPGEKPAYSNIGFGLLAVVIEQITDLPFSEFTKQEVFTPLNMPSTVWFHSETDKSKMAIPYGYKAIQQVFEPIGFYSFSNYPDGSLKTSSVEFMNFLYVFVNGGKTMQGKQYLKRETIDEMLTVQYPSIGGFTGLGWQSFGGGEYAHGGSDPGVNSLVVISPAAQKGLITFSNVGGLQALRTEIGFEIRNYIVDYIDTYGFPKAN